MGKGIFEIFVCMVFFFFSIRKSVIMDSMSKEKKGKETENQIEEKRSQIKISVRNLVEFIFREGDIDNRHGQSVSPEAMLAGSRMHRRIQKRMGSDYHAEVPLKLVIGEENYDLVLEGRADGIQITSESEREIDYSSNFNSMTIEEDMNVVIDEIKGVYLKLEQLAEPVRVHKAQAMCYAYIFALQHDIERIGIQMTYVNLDTEEIKYFHEDFTFAALEEWFDDLIRAYKKGQIFSMHGGSCGRNPYRNCSSHFLTGKAEGARCRSVPHDKTEKESVYPGADRSWKDDFHCFSGGESGGRKSWRPYFLSDGKDNHGNGGKGSV